MPGILGVGFSSLGCVSSLQVDGSMIGSVYIGGFNLAVGECTKACLELCDEINTHITYIYIYIYTHTSVVIYLFICSFANTHNSLDVLDWQVWAFCRRQEA